MSKKITFDEPCFNERLQQLLAENYPVPSKKPLVFEELKRLPIGTPCYVISQNGLDFRMFAGMYGKINPRTQEVEVIIEFFSRTGSVKSKLKNLGNTFNIYKITLENSFKTSAGTISTRTYDDSCAKGIQVLLDDTIVAMLDVYEPKEGESEGEARVLIYKKDYPEDEEAPIACVSINRN